LAAVYSGAYSVVTSISVIGLYFSYIIPVYLSRRGRATGGLGRGPWHLGRYSGAINIVAMAWVAFISVVLCTYDGFKPAKTILTLMVILGLWYVAAERKRFAGPQWGKGSDAGAGLTPILVTQKNEEQTE